ncbi:MAG: hypothetical protein R3Y57_04055 [Erysipelotrichaceae bacterium]
MICQNCGAQFHENETRCPYCGYLNVAGSHKQYKHKMKSIKDDLGELDGVSKQLYQQEFKRQGKHTFKIMSVVGLCLFMVAAFTGISFYLHDFSDSVSTDALSQQIAWQQETFPILDAWYEDQDYDAIVTYQNEYYAKDSPYSFYSWSHHNFIVEYREYTNIALCEELIDLNLSFHTLLSEIAITYYHDLTYYTYGVYTEEEMVLLEQYHQEKLTYILSFGISEEAFINIMDEADQEEIFDYEMIDSFFLDIERNYYD